ncbi:MAG: ABC transporter substrate-binding protein [Thermoplasmata archaeon]|jgi:peptide/nickel transport system substrate-binding protein|nr:ABC transporter substrate-binding protein [Thermoplasmata archaeon]
MLIPISGIVGITANADAADPNELVIGYLQQIDSLNPYVGLSDVAYVYYGLVYDAMSVIDNDMQPTPDLAQEAFPVPADQLLAGEPYGSVWQYNLYQNVVWSDGEPFDADDMVYNINLNAGNYSTMWAYQPYSYFMKWSEKVDDYTVRVKYFNPLNGTLMPCAYAYLLSIPMLPKHLLQQKSPANISFDWEGYFSSSESAEPIVCTGPFKGSPTIGQDYENRDPITLLRNPTSHWITNHGLDIQFEKLTLKFFQDTTAMALALEQGTIDAAAYPPQAFRELQDRVETGELKDTVAVDAPKITQYWTEIAFSMLSTGDPDLNNAKLDKEVRHALHMATDKDKIIDQYYLGLAEEGTTLIPPVNKYWHYNLTDDEKVDFSLDAAAALLEAAGYRDIDDDGIREVTADSWTYKEGYEQVGKDLSFHMMIRREYPEEKQIAIFLQDQWSKIGVELSYDVYDEVTMSVKAYSWQYDTMIWYWSADIDPNYQMFSLSAKAIGGWSDNHWDNASYEENYTNSVTTLDPVQRREYVFNCQRIHYDDTPYIILAYVNQTWLYKTDRFEGWGDWENDPGRSVDNFWMGNPLYWDLTYIGDGGEIDPLMVGIGLGVVAAVVAALVLLRMRGKKKESLSDESPLGD